MSYIMLECNQNRKLQYTSIDLTVWAGNETWQHYAVYYRWTCGHHVWSSTVKSQLKLIRFILIWYLYHWGFDGGDGVIAYAPCGGSKLPKSSIAVDTTPNWHIAKHVQTTGYKTV